METARLEPGSQSGGCYCGPGERLLPQTQETAATGVKADTSLVGPVVKELPCHARDRSSIPSQGTKIPRASGQLSPYATTAEPTPCN